MINLLKQAWAIFVKNIRPFAWASFIYLLIEVFFGFALSGSYSRTIFGWVDLMDISLTIIRAIVRLTLTVGMVYMALKAIEGQAIKVRDLFGVKPKVIGNVFLSYILLMVPVMICIGLAVGFSVLLYNFANLGLGIIPISMVLIGVTAFLVGLFTFIKFFPFIPLILDKEVGPIKALKMSWVMTRGDAWFIFKVILIGTIIYTLGAITILGLLIAMPLVAVTFVLAYKQIAAKELPAISN